MVKEKKVKNPKRGMARGSHKPDLLEQAMRLNGLPASTGHHAGTTTRTTPIPPAPTNLVVGGLPTGVVLSPAMVLPGMLVGSCSTVLLQPTLMPTAVVTQQRLVASTGQGVILPQLNNAQTLNVLVGPVNPPGIPTAPDCGKRFRPILPKPCSVAVDNTAPPAWSVPPARQRRQASTKKGVSKPNRRVSASQTPSAGVPRTAAQSPVGQSVSGLPHLQNLAQPPTGLATPQTANPTPTPTTMTTTTTAVPEVTLFESFSFNDIHNVVQSYSELSP